MKGGYAMQTPKIVTEQEWEDARQQLLGAECEQLGLTPAPAGADL